MQPTGSRPVSLGSESDVLFLVKSSQRQLVASPSLTVQRQFRLTLRSADELKTSPMRTSRVQPTTKPISVVRPPIGPDSLPADEITESIGIYEEMERIAGMEPACKLAALPFDEVNKFLANRGRNRQEPVPSALLARVPNH
jgi:hypothetical protein